MLSLPRFFAGEVGGVVKCCRALPLNRLYFDRFGYPGTWFPNPPCPPLPLEGVGEGPWEEGVGVTVPTGIIAVPGGGPYWVFGNGCLGGAPLQTVLLGMGPAAVTTLGPVKKILKECNSSPNGIRTHNLLNETVKISQKQNYFFQNLSQKVLHYKQHYLVWIQHL